MNTKLILKRPKIKVTEELMAMNIAELFSDFDPELQKLVEKTIIDYYLKKGNNDVRG